MMLTKVLFERSFAVNVAVCNVETMEHSDWTLKKIGVVDRWNRCLCEAAEYSVVVRYVINCNQ